MYNNNIIIQIKTKIIKDSREYYKNNKDRILEHDKEYRYLNKNRIKTHTKEYYENNKDKLLEHHKEYYQLNKQKLLEQKKEYYNLNIDKINERNRIYVKHKRNSNPIYRLIQNNRRRISHALESNSKVNHTIELLGCNKEFSYHFIKFLLPYDMNDEEFRNKYDIDHVVPLSSFDLSIPENQFIAFNWQNCSPLLNRKNCSKGAKRDLWSELIKDLKVTIF